MAPSADAMWCLSFPPLVRPSIAPPSALSPCQLSAPGEEGPKGVISHGRWAVASSLPEARCTASLSYRRTKRPAAHDSREKV
ncbi:hypothetical protein E2C01_050454 [Portunus trituberculatus]|uniref:Uncharacterized protein n=1 Tax=Portunus trituberculatus TaxID=210409 RepID=A0A5B7GGJ4_PORTR|nr:hypothetical protein [Portunus trituberculatus]